MTSQTQTRETYEAYGPVRGSCGHQHRTIEAARQCAERDARECRQYGGAGAYSDRTGQPSRSPWER